MARRAASTSRVRIPTETAVSAGGVVFRGQRPPFEIVLIEVGDKRRWQLPKGLVDAGETPEATALREVREEAGVNARLVEPLDVVEYWYVTTQEGRRVRLHKFVHFFLLAYVSGDVRDHDREVHEARWVELDVAGGMLAFEGERRVVERARERLGAGEESATDVGGTTGVRGALGAGTRRAGSAQEAGSRGSRGRSSMDF